MGLFLSRLSPRYRNFPTASDGEIRMDAPNAPIDDITPADPLSFPWFRMSTQWRISVPLSSGQLSDTSTQDQLRNVAAQLRRARNGTLF